MYDDGDDGDDDKIRGRKTKNYTLADPRGQIYNFETCKEYDATRRRRPTDGDTIRRRKIK